MIWKVPSAGYGLMVRRRGRHRGPKSRESVLGRKWDEVGRFEGLPAPAPLDPPLKAPMRA